MKTFKQDGQARTRERTKDGHARTRTRTQDIHVRTRERTQDCMSLWLVVSQTRYFLLANIALWPTCLITVLGSTYLAKKLINYANSPLSLPTVFVDACRPYSEMLNNVNKLRHMACYTQQCPSEYRRRDSKACPDFYRRGKHYAMIGRLTSRSRLLTRPPCHRARVCCGCELRRSNYELIYDTMNVSITY